MNTDATFEGKMTCALKNDMEFNKFLPKHVKMYELKIYRFTCHDNEE